MKKCHNITAFLLAVTLVNSMANVRAENNFDVKNIGELKSIASAELNGKVLFNSLLKQKPLYGIGMANGLNAEVLILADKPYVSGFREMAYQYPLTNNPEISFLAYSYVDKWQSINLPLEVNNFQKLEAYLPVIANKMGLDTTKPFPFLISAEASYLQWFVVNGMGNLQPNPLSSFVRGRYLGGLNDVKIEGLGFYSTKYQGIFTTPGNNMHIHFKTMSSLENGMTNNQTFIGHLDNSIQLKSGAVIQLPANQ